MPRASKGEMRFVKALLGGGVAKVDETGGFATAAPLRASIAAESVNALRSQGVLLVAGGSCKPSAEAAGWLKRQMLEPDDLAAQHRVPARGVDGVALNLGESPLARLATAANGEPAYLLPHQVEAGERFRRLAERAQLRQRTTMSYDANRVASQGPSRGAGDITDTAADARRKLADIARVLPRDCADVLFDVCAWEKGLQLVEAERGWPRRSAKLVLRIALEQLALVLGIGGAALGPEGGRARAWLADGRPPMFPES